MRFGTVALVGRTNVGKSTFLNQALGENLAITSPLPQTTRDALLGIAMTSEAQIAFIDTPGFHRPRTELGKRMNNAALDAVLGADLVLFMTDAWTKPVKEISSAFSGERPPQESPQLRPGDYDILCQVTKLTKAPILLVVNKADTAKDKTILLPMLEAYTRLHPFIALVPTSVRSETRSAELLKLLGEHLPEGPAGYDADTLTNRPVLFFVREYIREAVLNQLKREVPHAIAVSITTADESPTLLRTSATIHVEKAGQRKIVVGAGGAQIKAIGMAARKRIEELIGKKVHLELFVRITTEWKNTPRQLAELGYDVGQSVPRHNPRAEPDRPDATSTSPDDAHSPHPAPAADDTLTTKGRPDGAPTEEPS